MSFVKMLPLREPLSRRVHQSSAGRVVRQEATAAEKDISFFPSCLSAISGSGHSDSYSLDSAAEQAADTEREITGNQKETGDHVVLTNRRENKW